LRRRLAIASALAGAVFAASCASSGMHASDSGANPAMDEVEDSVESPLPVSEGADRGITFAGIRWGTPADSVAVALARLGYSRITKTADGDLEFQGAALLGHPTLGHAGIARGVLAKVSIELLVDSIDARSTYKSLRDALIKENGAPDDTIETVNATNDSLRTGGASLFLVWGGPRHKSQSTMTLEVTPELTVAIEYEWAMWAVEVERRRRGEK
jgi:hypothetical protein